MKPSRKIKRYGWHPDLPDHRDFKLGPPALAPEVFPSQVDLRILCPEVYNQGDLGSCTAQALSAAYAVELKKQALPLFAPSRLFLYYNERVLEGDPGQDNGAQLRDGLSSLTSQGICPEDQWPYVEAQFAVKPPEACYTAAQAHQALQYLRIPGDLNSLKACLVSGYPFVLGITVFDSFESAEVAQTGLVPLPGPEEACLGGHAVLAVGYDESRKSFLIRNSWGSGWGLQGYFYLPYAYLLDLRLGSDYWTLRTVE